MVAWEIYGLALLLAFLIVNFLAALEGAKITKRNLLASEATALNEQLRAAKTMGNLRETNIVEVKIDPQGTQQSIIAVAESEEGARMIIAMLRSAQPFNTDYYSLPRGEKLLKVK